MVVWVGLFTVFLSQSAISEPMVQGVTIEGRSVEGRWQGFDDQGRIVLQADDATNALLPAEISNLSWPGRAATTQPTESDHPWMIHLPDQSRFAAALAGSEEGTLEFHTGYVDSLVLTLSEVAAIQCAHIGDKDLTRQFLQLMEKRDPTEDTLLVLRDGNISQLKGVTEALNAERISFKWRNRSREFPIDSIFGLIIAAGVQSQSVPAVQCFLRGDDIWAGRLVGGDAGRIILERGGGNRVTLPVSQLSEIRFRSDRVFFLSDLTPKEYECKPFATTQWEWRRDRSVANRPLRIGKRSYARGIGMHSQSSLVYELEPGYAHFAADIGIDEAVGYHGHVVMRVLADDKEVFNSGPVTGRDEPTSILVPINNVRQLTLVVDYGQELDIGDQANWANARLVK